MASSRKPNHSMNFGIYECPRNQPADVRVVVLQSDQRSIRHVASNMKLQACWSGSHLFRHVFKRSWVWCRKDYGVWLTARRRYHRQFPSGCAGCWEVPTQSLPDTDSREQQPRHLLSHTSLLFRRYRVRSQLSPATKKVTHRWLVVKVIQKLRGSFSAVPTNIKGPTWWFRR